VTTQGAELGILAAVPPDRRTEIATNGRCFRRFAMRYGSRAEF
jgi:hypothetical protein